MQERALCSSNTPVKGNLSRESPKQSECRERERERNLRNLNTVCVGDLKSLYMHLLVKSRYAGAILD